MTHQEKAIELASMIACDDEAKRQEQVKAIETALDAAFREGWQSSGVEAVSLLCAGNCKWPTGAAILRPHERISPGRYRCTHCGAERSGQRAKPR